jgi:hypothetical protein
METKTTMVKEEIGRGTRGGPYIYVVEGKNLIHISNYAIKRLSGEYEDEVIYEVPTNKIAGKVLYCFDFSRSGGAFLGKCKIEDFEDGRPKKYEYYELLEKSISEIRNLRFYVENPILLSLLAQFEQLFIPMIQEIKEYERLQNFKISFMGHEERLENAFENPEVYYFAFMSLPNDRSRINSLKVTRKWIYQLWILKLLCNALQVFKFKGHEYEGKPYWWIEQGSDFSTCIGETPIGNITFWIEFQPDREAHMRGMFVGRHFPIRPDIIAVRGCFERTKDFIESKKSVDLIIECKEDPFDKWKNEIESQILPYQQIFKPSNFIVVSLEHIPDVIKRDLGYRKIRVVDDLRPNGESIRTFYDLARKGFGIGGQTFTKKAI